MNSKNVTSIKIVAATITFLGTVFGFIERYWAPDAILSEKPYAPAWVGWLGWILVSIAALTYIFVDFFSSRKPPKG